MHWTTCDALAWNAVWAYSQPQKTTHASASHPRQSAHDRAATLWERGQRGE
jgi:hypothetical protein